MNHPYYHVTETANWPNIQKEGLLPKIGPRSAELGEPVPRIYLFPSRDDMETALCGWLGDEFDESTPLVSLEIIIPDTFPIADSSVEYEVVSDKPILPEYIRFLQNE